MLLAIQSISSLRDGFRFLRLLRASRLRKPGDFAPRVALTIPVKGFDSDLAANLSAFLKQDYPDYALSFVVASKQDPAYELLSELVAQNKRAGSSTPGRAREVRLLVAGYSGQRGEKVNNLLCGVAAAGVSAGVLAFADADARPRPDWLRSLVAPLADPGVTVSTGFRWYLPGSGFVSQLRAAWDTSIATLLGEHKHNFAWGGSMALRASDFARLGIAEKYWANTVSDDYGVTRAVHEARGRIRFEPRCLLASREESTFAGFMKWANRQIILTRVYSPSYWRLGLAANTLYCGTFLFGLALLVLPTTALQLRIGTAASLLAVLSLGIAKGYIRTVVARELFADELNPPGTAARYWQLVPLVSWVMWLNFIVAGFCRRIEWKGTRYELRSANEVRVLRRDES